MTELFLGIVTFFTSTIAAIVGLGGGMMLITILPSFLPINALIPVHGLTQMTSNLSRAVFGYKDVQYETSLSSSGSTVLCGARYKKEFKKPKDSN